MRSRIDTNGLRNLATIVSITQLAQELGVCRPSIYAYLDGRLPVNQAIADRVNANLRRLQRRSALCEVVAAGINARANNRLSVRSLSKGPMTKYEVLRYNLGPLDQRYDASDNTLLVTRYSLHQILHKSSLVASMKQARDDLIARNLITLQSNPQPNLALGCALPHRPVDAYLIDLHRIEWATLQALVHLSAKRTDPCDTGIIYTRQTKDRQPAWQGMLNGLRSSFVP